MSCSPPPTAEITKDLPVSVEARIEEDNGDFTGWSAASAEVLKSHEKGLREGDLLFSPTITFKEIVAADAANDIPASLAYSVELTVDQVNSLWRNTGLLKVIFLDANGTAAEKGIWILDVCLQPHE